MKCNELQIFDWITDNNGFRWQIICVGNDYAYATFEGNEGDPWEFVDKDDQPQPIEITAELLKANGWKVVVEKFCDVICYECCVKDENGNHLEWMRGTLTVWFDYEKGNDGVYSDIVIPVKYVHQLQQVLRLAGMTDMANNFKV